MLRPVEKPLRHQIIVPAHNRGIGDSSVVGCTQGNSWLFSRRFHALHTHNLSGRLESLCWCQRFEEAMTSSFSVARYGVSASALLPTVLREPQVGTDVRIGIIWGAIYLTCQAVIVMTCERPVRIVELLVAVAFVLHMDCDGAAGLIG